VVRVHEEGAGLGTIAFLVQSCFCLRLYNALDRIASVTVRKMDITTTARASQVMFTLPNPGNVKIIWPEPRSSCGPSNQVNGGSITGFCKFYFMAPRFEVAAKNRPIAGPERKTLRITPQPCNNAAVRPSLRTVWRYLAMIRSGL
jgi:hypothetical protein